jgi:A/G-specific adenine glycosylase
VHQRSQKDIWLQLYEFYLIETEGNKNWKENDIYEYVNNQFAITKADIVYISPQLSQQLTHQTVHAVFIKIKLAEAPSALKHYKWVSKEQLQQFAFPKIINEYLQSTSFPAILF